MRNTTHPEKIIMIGNCRISIFRNLVLKDGKEIELPKVVLEIRYRDKTGRWRSTQAMTLREIPKAILALQKAFDCLTSKRIDEPRSFHVDASTTRQ
jgi:hypothetical protein